MEDKEKNINIKVKWQSMGKHANDYLGFYFYGHLWVSCSFAFVGLMSNSQSNNG